MNYSDCLAIGKIVKPVGLKGRLKVILLSDFPEKFCERKELYLFDEVSGRFLTGNDNSHLFRVVECSYSGKYIRIGFEGYDSIEEITKLVGALVMIDEDKRADLKEGLYYYYDLIGLQAECNDKIIGKIEAVVDYGSGDLFKITDGKKEILVPFRNEFVKNIDLKNNRVVLDLIEGFV